MSQICPHGDSGSSESRQKQSRLGTRFVGRVQNFWIILASVPTVDRLLNPIVTHLVWLCARRVDRPTCDGCLSFAIHGSLPASSHPTLSPTPQSPPLYLEGDVQQDLMTPNLRGFPADSGSWYSRAGARLPQVGRRLGSCSNAFPPPCLPLSYFIMITRIATTVPQVRTRWCLREHPWLALCFGRRDWYSIYVTFPRTLSKAARMIRGALKPLRLCLSGWRPAKVFDSPVFKPTITCN